MVPYDGIIVRRIMIHDEDKVVLCYDCPAGSASHSHIKQTVLERYIYTKELPSPKRIAVINQICGLCLTRQSAIVVAHTDRSDRTSRPRHASWNAKSERQPQ